MNLKELITLADKEVAWAQGRLGTYYINGDEGLVPSKEVGHEYIVKAAVQGHKQALYDVGCMYLEGVGCKADSDKGLHFLMEAGKKYHTDSFLILSKYAMTTIKDHELAYYYYMLYMGCGDNHEDEDKETLLLIKECIDAGIAKSTYKEAEEFIKSKPLNNAIEVLDYSGVYVNVYQNDNNETKIEISVAANDEYYPAALDAANEITEQMTT